MHAMQNASRQPEQSVQAGSHAGEPEEFLEIVDSLEVASEGRPLEGSGRARCLRAFTETPRGFELLVDRAIREAHTNPVGLLIWMVDRGQHLKADRAARRNGADVVDEGIEF